MPLPPISPSPPTPAPPPQATPNTRPELHTAPRFAGWDSHLTVTAEPTDDELLRQLQYELIAFGLLMGPPSDGWDVATSSAAQSLSNLTALPVIDVPTARLALAKAARAVQGIRLAAPIHLVPATAPKVLLALLTADDLRVFHASAIPAIERANGATAVIPLSTPALWAHISVEPLPDSNRNACRTLNAGFYKGDFEASLHLTICWAHQKQEWILAD
jgi:hypothetical protein